MWIYYYVFPHLILEYAPSPSAAHLPPLVEKWSQFVWLSTIDRPKNPLAPTQNSSVHQLTAKDRDQTDHKAGGSKQEQQKGFLS